MAALTRWQRDNSVPGMFYWPEEVHAAAGKLCGVCQHAYQPAAAADKIRCVKAAAAMRESGRRGKPALVPGDTPGCKYWEARP